MSAFAAVSGLIFAVVCVAHGARLYFHWPVRVATMDIPDWISWVGAVVSGVLALWAWQLATTGG